MEGRSYSDGDIPNLNRHYSRSPPKNRSKEQISRPGLLSEVSSEMLPIQIELKTEPFNPCAICVSDRETSAIYLWAYMNLILSFIHTVYKFWLTIMLSGGTHPVLAVYAYIYVLFCSRTDLTITLRGYCFDFVSQLLYALGSVLFFLAVSDLKEGLKEHKKLFTRIYICTILTLIVGSIVPQTLFWFFDGHCIPPEGMSLCKENNTRGQPRIVQRGYSEGSKRNCFPITHTYFIIVYFSTIVFMGVYMGYSVIVARSYLHFIKKSGTSTTKRRSNPKVPKDGRKQSQGATPTTPRYRSEKDLKFTDNPNTKPKPTK